MNGSGGDSSRFSADESAALWRAGAQTGSAASVQTASKQGPLTAASPFRKGFALHAFKHGNHVEGEFLETCACLQVVAPVSGFACGMLQSVAASFVLTKLADRSGPRAFVREVVLVRTLTQNHHRNSS